MWLPLLTHCARRHDFIVDSRGRARRPGQPGKQAAGLATLAVAGALTIAAPTTRLGGDLLAQGRTALTNAVDLIRSRSPGLRTRAQLTKIKTEYRARLRPIARARPRPHRPVVAAAAPALLAPPPPAIPLAFAAPELVPASFVPGPFPFYDFAQPQPCPCGLAFVPVLLGGGVLFGGPPLPGGGGTGVVPPPPPPPGVPEPGPWALMILGFGAAGWAWRRRRTLILLVGNLPLLFYAPARVALR